MVSRIITLFGEEEIIPENLAAAPKIKGKKKSAKPDTATSQTSAPGDAETITVLAGWQPEKQYYTIGEVAALFSVRTSHIRFWTNEFNLKVRTTRKGDRLYTPALIDRLRVVYHLVKDLGYTIPGAKAKMKATKKGSVESMDLKQSLLQLRNQLLMIRNQLV